MKYLKIHTLNKGQWYDRDDFPSCRLPDPGRLHGARTAGEIVDWEHDELHSNAWASSRSCIAGGRRSVPTGAIHWTMCRIPPEEEYVFTEDGQLIFPDRVKYPEYYEAMKKSADLEAEWLRKTSSNCTA